MDREGTIKDLKQNQRPLYLEIGLRLIKFTDRKFILFNMRQFIIYYFIL